MAILISFLARALATSHLWCYNSVVCLLYLRCTALIVVQVSSGLVSMLPGYAFVYTFE